MSTIKKIISRMVQSSWWDDMTPKEQKNYLKDHPNSRKAKNAKESSESPKKLKKPADKKHLMTVPKLVHYR